MWSLRQCSTLRESHDSEDSVQLVMVVRIAGFDVFLATVENWLTGQELGKDAANGPYVCRVKNTLIHIYMATPGPSCFTERNVTINIHMTMTTTITIMNTNIISTSTPPSIQYQHHIITTPSSTLTPPSSPPSPTPPPPPSSLSTSPSPNHQISTPINGYQV